MMDPSHVGEALTSLGGIVDIDTMTVKEEEGYDMNEDVSFRNNKGLTLYGILSDSYQEETQIRDAIVLCHGLCSHRNWRFLPQLASGLTQRLGVCFVQMPYAIPIHHPQTISSFRNSCHCHPHPPFPSPFPLSSPSPSPLLRVFVFTMVYAQVAVLRFDFSGNGESEGQWQYCAYRAQMLDIHAAVEFLRCRNFNVVGVIG